MFEQLGCRLAGPKRGDSTKSRLVLQVWYQKHSIVHC